jgi:hypothetical protein
VERRRQRQMCIRDRVNTMPAASSSALKALL